jgi:carbonic anhydrase
LIEILQVHLKRKEMGNNKENNDKITPSTVVDLLKEGNQNFVDNWMQKRNYREEVRETSGGQTPFAAILSCLDSRVPVEAIFDLGIGDVFSFRAAGNFVDQKIEENNNILGSLEFAKASGVQLILVLGHTGCGAINAAVGTPDPNWCGPMGVMVKRLRSNILNKGNVIIKDKKEATRVNVTNTIKHIKEHSSCLRNFEFIGGIYDITTGEVEFI